MNHKALRVEAVAGEVLDEAARQLRDAEAERVGGAVVLGLLLALALADHGTGVRHRPRVCSWVVPMGSHSDGPTGQSHLALRGLLDPD